MRDYAILIFQRSQLGDHIHPFVLSEVDAFCKRYVKVYLVCFAFDTSITELERYSNLEIVSIPISKAKHNYNSVFTALKTYGVEDATVAIKNRVFNKKYFAESFKVFMFGKSLADEADRILALHYQEGNWTVQGYWLTGPAYAAALLKKKYPRIFAFARAHSSEIDIVRNPYSICQYKKFIYEYLDAIFFVSQWGKNNFETQIMPKHHVDSFEKDFVSRLGINKICDGVNSGSNDNIFRIISCSRMVELKRLDLLVDALSLLKNDRRICWTHIGDGPEMDRIVEKTKTLPENVQCIFLGNVPNNEVHQYLCTAPVDLFINISLYEGLPVSVMEALSYAIPVIATNAGGTSEIVCKENGVLLPVDVTVNQIAKSIEYFLYMDSKKYECIKKHSFETWQANYNKDSNYNSLFSLIDSMSSRS